MSSLFTLRRDTTRNNDLALREYEDLVRWVRDNHKAEAEALAASTTELAARGILDSGERGVQERMIREKLAHQWRDRGSASERRIRDIAFSENMFHWLWRQLARKPWPTDPHRDEIDRLTRGWRQ